MDMEKIRSVVAEKSARSNILVVGDVMLDKYYTGEVTRISPEAPVPITHVTGTRETLGGAANVAHNLALLGTNVSIAGYVGRDAHCDSLLDKFKSRGIDYAGLVHTERPTTTKIRIIGGHQQMLRLDFEDVKPIDGADAEQYLAYIDQKLTRAWTASSSRTTARAHARSTPASTSSMRRTITASPSSSIRRGHSGRSTRGRTM